MRGREEGEGSVGRLVQERGKEGEREEGGVELLLEIGRASCRERV